MFFHKVNAANAWIAHNFYLAGMLICYLEPLLKGEFVQLGRWQSQEMSTEVIQLNHKRKIL